MTSDSRADRSGLLLFVRLPIAVALVALAARARTETDIWGHIRFGLDLLASRQLPTFDTYSFTSTQPWVNHEWVSDLIFAGAYQAGGLVLLAVVRALIAVALLVILHRGLRELPWPWRDELLLAGILLSLPLLNAVRPQIFSLPLYALTLVALSRDAKWLPLVFLLWANLHGGWMIGFGAVLTHALAHPSRGAWTRLALCAAATLVNPYGVHLWLSLADAVTRGWSDVTEWQPIWAKGLGMGDALAWCAVVLGLAWGLRRRADASWWALAWCVIVGIAAARARRHLPFFAVTVILLVFSRLRLREVMPPNLKLTAPAAAILTVPVLAAVGAAFMLVRSTATCLPSYVPPVRPEASAVQFIRSADIRGRVLMWFDWGLYAIWHVGDQIKVSVDNRRETVYPDDVIAAHRRFYFEKDVSYPDRLGADYVWIPPGLQVGRDLIANGWHEVYRGERSMILGRTPRPVVLGEPYASACFPDP